MDVLIGVHGASKTILNDMNIETVFDLANSTIFQRALLITSVDDEEGNAFAKHGRFPSDMVAEDDNEDVLNLKHKDLTVINGIHNRLQQRIQNVLGVNSIRELALFPPFRAARAILDRVFFPENDLGFDPEAPSDLIPKTGEYPTERVQYSTLILDTIENDDGNKIDFSGGNFRPVDITAEIHDDWGYSQVATGALLSFNQSWYAQGVTLGQLLHSTALAPGESTRIAVIDWSRKDRGKQSEKGGETEFLENATDRSRSISEVTEAVATEAQEGFSNVAVNSKSKQSGSSSGSSAAFWGAFGGSSGGKSSGSSSSSGKITAHSTTNGRRDISSEMNQNILDRTHQHAHASRTRRASVVREVSQSEHESISTRVVTNYNHMHAMTVQYYEVLQAYRVEVMLEKVEKAIFIPFKLFDFTLDIVRRYKYVLADVALNEEIREALLNSDFQSFDNGIQPPSFPPVTIEDAYEEPTSIDGETLPVDIDKNPFLGFDPNEGTYVNKNRQWDLKSTRKIEKKLKRAVQLDAFDGIRLPSEMVLKNVTSDIQEVKVLVNGFEVSAQGGEWAVTAIEDISLQRLPTNSKALKTSVTLHFEDANGRVHQLKTNEINMGESTQKMVLMSSSLSVSDEELLDHLNANKLYYNQAIFHALDAPTLSTLLSGYSYTYEKAIDDNTTQKVTVPVIETIDPVPIAISGNYLAFKLNIADHSEWESWKEEKGLIVGEKSQDIVPLSSGGVFAEAVLGRYNSAEKLDMTRFWNWQDSPLPLTPTEIGAIKAGSRSDQPNLEAGNLSTPVVQISNPVPLPDPAGTAAVLAAVQNGSMFRDMSGLQSAMSLLDSSLRSTTQAATDAAAQAGQNMSEHLRAEVERLRAIADVVKTAITKMPSGSAASMLPMEGSPVAKNISNSGAALNHGARLDNTRINSVAAPSSGPVVPNAGYSGGATATNSGSPSSGTSYEERVFESLTGSNRGLDVANANYIERAPGLLGKTMIPTLSLPTLLGGDDPQLLTKDDVNNAFDATKGKLYYLKVFADQPGAGGDRDTHWLGNVGHAFLELSKLPEQGDTQRLVFGFYPRGSVLPLSPFTTANGILKNDEGRVSEAEVCREFDIDEAAFLKVIELINTTIDGGILYDLNTFNCADFAIEMAGACSVFLPDTRGEWPGGGGSNPGDLGEDLRNLNFGRLCNAYTT